ncbi:MAG: DUF2155 domain-containing protein [Alphaproteobacteria bacterium]|nr:DUF2155 domain-containing protein [Alphaproteobacteria bacterium]
MKCLARFLAIFVVAVFGFTCASHAYIEHNTAVLRVLNKAAGKVHVVRVPVGHSVEFEKLNIVARKCMQSDPFDAENYFAFIEINEQKQIFGGWMNRNEPGKNPLQNPDWDVWLVNCE